MDPCSDTEEMLQQKFEIQHLIKVSSQSYNCDNKLNGTVRFPLLKKLWNTVDVLYVSYSRFITQWLVWYFIDNEMSMFFFYSFNKSHARLNMAAAVKTTQQHPVNCLCSVGFINKFWNANEAHSCRFNIVAEMKWWLYSESIKSVQPCSPSPKVPELLECIILFVELSWGEN